MRTNLIILIICLCSSELWAQDNRYERRGDDYFAQAQYENALKQYNAAVELAVDNSVLKQKQAKCKKCMDLLSKAKDAENSNMYESANTYYMELFTIHSLPIYKNKAEMMKKMLLEIERKNRWVKISDIDYKVEGDRRVPTSKIYVKKLRFNYNHNGSTQYCFIYLKSDSNPKYRESFSIPGDQYGKAGALNTLKAKCKHLGNNIYEYEIMQVNDAYIQSWQSNFLVDAVEYQEP